MSIREISRIGTKSILCTAMAKREPKLFLLKLQCLLLLFTLIIGGLLSSSAQAQNLKSEITFNHQYFIEKLQALLKKDNRSTRTDEIKQLCELLNDFPDSADLRPQIIKELLTIAEKEAAASLDDAEVFWSAAETLAKQEPDELSLATTIYYRANTLNGLDRYQEALVNYRRSIELLNEKKGNSLRRRQLLCQNYATAGEIADYLEDSVAAQNFFNAGWQILEKTPNWQVDKAFQEAAKTILIGQGESARNRGESAKAKQKFAEALTLIKDNPYQTAEVLWNLGKLEREAGRYDAGAASFTKALEVLDEWSASTERAVDKSSLKANLLNSYGLLLLEQRSPPAAKQKLDLALSILGQIHDQRLEATVLRNLSIAARQTGDFETAKKYAEDALQIAVNFKSDDLYISASNILAGILQSQGKHLEATKLLQSSVARAESSQNLLRLTEGKWRLGESLLALKNYKEAEELANECLETSQKRGWSNLIYLSATLKGRALVAEADKTIAKTMFDLAVREIEEKRFAVNGAEVEKISFMSDKTTAYHELLKLHADADEVDHALAFSEKLKSRVLTEKFHDSVAKSAQIESLINQTSAIPSDSTVVSFTLTDEKCFAFTLRAQQKPKLVVIETKESELVEKVTRWRKSLADFDPKFKTEAKELYKLLLDKLEAELNETKSLVIVPDGVLWELPFQALITASNQYLIEKHTVAYAPSLEVYYQLQSSSRSAVANKQVLAFANPATKSAASLIEAEREISEVGKLYQSPKIFVKTGATEARFKQNAPTATIIHLALHGVINLQSPFETALLFTPGAGEDGQLTISEIMRMRLPQSLIVLSSCDTSNGRILSAEGLLSVSWAFLAAGGRTVVAAQWAVESSSTANLMIDFHRALAREEKGAATALQTAQILAIKRAAPFNHPNYWSPFVVVGGSH